MGARVGLVKLFGKTIRVPAEADMKLDPFEDKGSGGSGREVRAEDDEDHCGKGSPVLTVESSGSASATDPLKEEGELESERRRASPVRRGIAGGGGKNPKPAKPEKILPCPRCSSMATKFCYYNNYNLNQPRHFCKNCQRYWTAGGTMRNVPVGAGRRKSKHAAAFCRPIAVIKAPFSPKENSDSAASFSGNLWAYPFSFHPAAGFWHVPHTSPSSSPAMAEPEGCLWFPKTLRIDDPVEAAKSSIWAAMGLSKEIAARGGLFGGFGLPKVNSSSAMPVASKAFQANPAAVSRSFSFQESSLLD